MNDFETPEEIRKQMPKRGNTRRRGYELAPQRDFTHLAVVAGVAAGLAHLLLLYCAPMLLELAGQHEILKPKVEDEEIRVVIKAPEQELEEGTPEAPPDEVPEPEEIAYEPAEIDILDADMEELDMAPGKTEIAIPKPVVAEEAVAADPEATMAPTELDVSAFHTEPLPPQELSVAEPTPLSSSDIVVNMTAQLEELAEAQDRVNSELRETAAKDGKEGLPSDTRSLAELLGDADPGSKSGVARLGADVLFGFNEIKLRQSARITMLQLAALIQKNPQTYFLIEGHTDSIGGLEYNNLLGLLRAGAVRDWLVSNNIPVQYVYIRSCGYHAPLVDINLPKEEQALNRRVEIHMRKGGEQMPEGAVPQSYAVDTTTSVSQQLQRGVRAPNTAAQVLVALVHAPEPKPAPLPTDDSGIPLVARNEGQDNYVGGVSVLRSEGDTLPLTIGLIDAEWPLSDGAKSGSFMGEAAPDDLDVYFIGRISDELKRKATRLTPVGDAAEAVPLPQAAELNAADLVARMAATASDTAASAAGNLSISAKLLFEGTEKTLSKGSTPALQLLADWMRKSPQTYFLIEGHTDSTGSERYNEMLGLMRAAVVRDWLTRNGVPAQQLYIRSCGSRRPMVDTRLSAEAQGPNRRVQIGTYRPGARVPEGAHGAKLNLDTGKTVAAVLKAGLKLPAPAAGTLPPLGGAAPKPAPVTTPKPAPVTKPAPAAKPASAAKPAPSAAAKPAKQPTSKTGAAALKKLQNNAKKKPAPANGKKR